ncbi:hypothetical protein BDM02DRAFT_3121474 [Thelephora ganbajun]|uniref:Uncharacterized protein n=1 Tax=Thelephora ganbajun TaxID=370292 RepID=A0ACB6Z582_THEGA|nr:hypothetical protein BDM02DRAFT_3121474 [Thelephora ganbajun]
MCYVLWLPLRTNAVHTTALPTAYLGPGVPTYQNASPSVYSIVYSFHHYLKGATGDSL